MHLSPIDRLMAGLACAFMCYRIYTAVTTGVLSGDEEPDVHADRRPGAFGLALLGEGVVAISLAVVVILPSGSLSQLG